MTAKAAIDAALRANKDHQYALGAYIERLESELDAADKMIDVVESDDDTEDIQENGLIYVEGAVKPVSVVLPRVLLSEDSPFFEDARWRKRYEEFTTVNQMKAKEHEVLREAVRTENMRMQVLEAQNRNQPIEVKSFPPEHFEQNTEGIDWRRVSVQMNSSLPTANPRTPEECRIRWLGHLHPSFNHSPWTPEETERLRAILAEDGPERSSRDWVEISRKLGTNRTPIDCMRHGMSRRIHTWISEADKRLLEAVELYGQNNWQPVAMCVSEDATAHQCQKRYLDSLNPSITSGPWTLEEEERLRRAIAAFTGQPAVDEDPGPSTTGKQAIPWQDVALFVPGRTNNQCREHYQDRILKTKGKQKDESDVGSAKGKEKATPTENLGDEEGDIAIDVANHAVEASTSAPGKQRSRRTAKPGMKDGIQEPDAAQSAPRSRPRPRSRKRANSTEESPGDSGPVVQLDAEVDLPEPPSTLLVSDDSSQPLSSSKKKDTRRSTGKSVSRKTGSKPILADTIAEPVDNSEDATSSTARTKRRKISPYPRPRKGKRPGPSAKASLKGAEDAGPSRSHATAPGTEGIEESGKRRSSRLLKGKS